jgi:Cys-tRNA(Pro)/Cys-tRNA(Cys) deacylase
MTPATNALKKAKIKYHIHPYDHDPEGTAYGEEAAQKLNISQDRLFKTLVVSTDSDSLAVALVPVSCQLDLKKFSKALGSKKTKMADKKRVEQSTGYIPGGVSPVAQKKKLKTIIDESAQNFDTIFVSAGRRGLQIELSPLDLARITTAVFKGISK